MKTMTPIEVCTGHANQQMDYKFIGKIWRRSLVHAFVYKNSELEVDRLFAFNQWS